MTRLVLLFLLVLSACGDERPESDCYCVELSQGGTCACDESTFTKNTPTHNATN